MTCARSEIVTPNEVGIYHCVTRCVRRAFLCGKDAYSGRSYEHRREWIRSRLHELLAIFAIDVVAYAIMNNHLHLVIRIRPDIANSWTPEEIARRWLLLFPQRRIDGKAAEPSLEEMAAITAQTDLWETYRKRLCSISWFNRCLNENIARRANVEEQCTGRFWEGRFKCQRVLDLPGLLACAAYVDLNPIRAGIASTPEESDHTSIQDRICEMTGQNRSSHQPWPHIPLVSIPEITNNKVTLVEYLRLVDESGRMMREGKRNISAAAAPILTRLFINSDRWVDITQNLEQQFRRVIGTADVMEAAAQKAQKFWFHGVNAARILFAKPRLIS